MGPFRRTRLGFRASPYGYRRAVDKREGQAFELMFLSEDVARGARLTAFYAADFDEQLALAREMIPLVYEP